MSHRLPSLFKSTSSTASLAIIILLSAWLGGCASRGPSSLLQAQVVSEPPGQAVLLQGKKVGVAPLQLNLSDLAEAATLTLAEADSSQFIERRIQIQTPTRVRVVLTVRDQPSDLAEALGLEDILVFDYGERASFEVDSYQISPAIEPLLEEQAKLLNRRFGDLNFYVCGHTDSSGEDDHNRILSVRRAQSVADILTRYGIDESRFNVQGFASDYPLAPNSSTEGRALNRRTEIVLGE